MSTHIKRDGGWLCGHDRRKGIFKRGYEPHISFTDAHKRVDMKGVCEDCQKEYYRRLSRLDPVVVTDEVVTARKKKKDDRIIQISDQLSTGDEFRTPPPEEPASEKASEESEDERRRKEHVLKMYQRINRIIRGY